MMKIDDCTGVREHVFYVFFRFKKNMIFLRFNDVSKSCKKSAKVESSIR